MKYLVATPFIPISKFLYSHRAAQGVIYADQLKNAGGLDVTVNMTLDRYISDFNLFDGLYAYHGNDWSGHLNIFGGLTDFPYMENFVNFSKFKGPVWSLACDFPDYTGFLEHKIALQVSKNKPYHPLWDQVDWKNLTRMKNEAVTVKIPGGMTDSLVIGDSHAICMYRPGWTVQSIPFKTLHGALSIGLINMVKDFYGDRVPKHVEFYFGNIDVRHHIMRLPDPEKTVRELAASYVEQAKDVFKYTGSAVVLYEPLPIENERRTIPKTGWYEGKPYHGTWDERNWARMALRNAMIEETKRVPGQVAVQDWTDHLLNEKGELSFDCMERPKSVHLSRAAYPHWQGWEWNGLKPPHQRGLGEFL